MMTSDYLYNYKLLKFIIITNMIYYFTGCEYPNRRNKDS